MVSKKSVDSRPPTSCHKLTYIDFAEGGNWMTKKRPSMVEIEINSAHTRQS